MSIEARKKKLIEQILETEDNEIISKVESAFETDFVAHSVKGKSLTETGYVSHLNKIIVASDNGEKGFSTQEMRKMILGK